MTNAEQAAMCAESGGDAGVKCDGSERLVTASVAQIWGALLAIYVQSVGCR